MQQGDSIALRPLYNDSAAPVEVTVQKRCYRLDPNSFTENLRVGDEVETALPQQPPT